MNEFFNFRRFRLYFLKTVLERPGQILGIFVLSFSVVTLVYYLLKSIGFVFEVVQLMSFTLGLAGGGCLLASLVFGYFSDTASSCSYMTLPVSVFEKWLCGVLLVGILYVGCFFLFFRGLDTLFVNMYHNGLNRQDPRYTDQYNAVTIFPFDRDSISIIVFFVNAAAAMLVGSLYFNRVSFIKVALVICGLYFITFLLNYLAASIFFKETFHVFPFHSMWVKNGDEESILVLNPGWSNLYDMIALYILPGILLAVSYIRLREKEV
ncbi:MAG: hypothetical protein M3N30_02620 [Bacteroidota bacterium]|nr:hypothetical protein [Bacteroidota bacterium]